MRQPFLVLLFSLCVVVSLTSSAEIRKQSLKDRFQRLPNPISSFWRGLKAGSSKIEKATNRIIKNVGYYKILAESFNRQESPTPKAAETIKIATPNETLTVLFVQSKEDDNNNIPADTRQLSSITSASHSSQTNNGAGSTYYSSNSHWQNVDGEVIESSYVSSLDNVANAVYQNKKTNTFKGTVLVPISTNPDFNKKFTVKSPSFPHERTSPIVSIWNVKVSKNCRRGLITMKIDDLSRLADEEDCSEGYYRVSPFMKQAKICGRIDTVPPFKWYIDDKEPEDVTITLRHNGLNDGYSEGLGFTLQGECLPSNSDMTKSKALKSYSTWMQKLYKDYATNGYPTVVIPGLDLASVTLASESPEPESNPAASEETDSLFVLNPSLSGSEPPIQPISPDQIWTPSSFLTPVVPVVQAASKPQTTRPTTTSSPPVQQSTVPYDYEWEQTQPDQTAQQQVPQRPNIPISVDEDLDDAISYITTLLEKPLKARKPLIKQ